MQQTKVTNSNRNEFYKFVYPASTMGKDALLNLDEYPGTKILFDCAGWHYQLHFPWQNIIKVENAQTCKEYQFDKSKFDKIFFKENYPSISVDGTLILDHSPLLKYKTEKDLNLLLLNLTDRIITNTIVIRMATVTMGDYRFTDRLKNLCNAIPDRFITEKLIYDPNLIFLQLKKKKEYGFN